MASQTGLVPLTALAAQGDERERSATAPLYATAVAERGSSPAKKAAKASPCIGPENR